MPYSVDTQQKIRDAILRDRRNLQPEADVTPDSDNFVRASGTSNAVFGLSAYQGWIAKQIFADSADDDYLERHAAQYLIKKKLANASTGSVLFSGTPSLPLGVGTQFKYEDGTAYTTTSAGVFDVDGHVTLDAQASAPGLAGNRSENSVVTLTAAPSGVATTATIITMTGGTDIEDRNSLLARLLDRKRRPPAGGNQYDYVRWALEVPGITQAWCYPLRRGAKTVDVAVLTNGVPPSDVLLAQTQAYIDSVRPIGLDFLALKPQLIAANPSATVSLMPGILLDDVLLDANALQAAYFSTLIPGSTAYRSRIVSLLSDVAGVLDVAPIAPIGNIVTRVDATHIEMPAVGNLTLTL